jgi:hypothetical protein
MLVHGFQLVAHGDAQQAAVEHDGAGVVEEAWLPNLFMKAFTRGRVVPMF